MDFDLHDIPFIPQNINNAFYQKLYELHKQQQIETSIIKDIKKQKVYSKYADKKLFISITFILVILGLATIIYWKGFTDNRIGDLGGLPQSVGIIQITILALIVPITIVLFQFVFKDSSYFHYWIKVIRIQTKVIFLTTSSILLTLTIFVVEYIRFLIDLSDLPESLIQFFACITFVWFILNCLVTYIFADASIKLATPSGQRFALKQFVVNTLYIEDVRNNTNICCATLQFIREPVIKSIKELNTSQFINSYAEYRNFHLLLLQLGEREISNKKHNISMFPIDHSCRQRFGDNWINSYYEVFEQAIIAFPKETQFFTICCNIEHSLMYNIFAVPSMPNGVNAISMHSYLLHKLIEYRNQKPATFQEEKYTVGIDTFIDQWKKLKIELLAKIHNTISWYESKIIFYNLKTHLEETLFGIGRALLNGDIETAKKLATELSRWCDQHKLPEKYKPIANMININLLNKSWNTEEGAKAWLIKKGISEPEISETLKAILIAYWQDASLLLVIFIIIWSTKTDKKYALSPEIVQKVLQPILSNFSTFPNDIFDFEKYFLIFLKMGLMREGDYFWCIPNFRDLYYKLAHLPDVTSDILHTTTRTSPLYECLDNSLLQQKLIKPFIFAMTLAYKTDAITHLRKDQGLINLKALISENDSISLDHLKYISSLMKALQDNSYDEFKYLLEDIKEPFEIIGKLLQLLQSVIDTYNVRDKYNIVCSKS